MNIALTLEQIKDELERTSNLAIAIHTATEHDIEEGTVPDYIGSMVILEDLINQQIDRLGDLLEEVKVSA